MDKSMKEILRYGVILFIITAVSAALLAGVNMLTEGQIAQNAVAAEQKALGEVMAEATAFEPLADEVSSTYGADAIYLAKNADGAVIGYCIKVSQNGYGGAVQSVIGITGEKLVTGVKVVSHAETPGLGANITNDSFSEQFIGKGKTQVVKAGAKEGEINAISGATISSKAMASSVNAAIDIVENMMMLGNENAENTTGEGEAADE